MTEGEEQEQVDALRAKHPGWSIARPEYFGRRYWQATWPGGPLLLRRTPQELAEAIGGSGWPR